MQKRYLVTLTEEEVRILEDILHRGKHAAQKRNRAHVLLLAHQNWTDEKIAQATQMSTRGVAVIRQHFVENGFETTLESKPRAPRKPVLDGRGEALLMALACSPAPEGHKRWTLRMLQSRLIIELELESLSLETVRQTLKKTNSNLGCE